MEQGPTSDPFSGGEDIYLSDILYKNMEPNAITNTIHPWFQVRNSGTTTLNLEDVTHPLLVSCMSSHRHQPCQQLPPNID